MLVTVVAVAVVLPSANNNEMLDDIVDHKLATLKLLYMGKTRGGTATKKKKKGSNLEMGMQRGYSDGKKLKPNEL